VSYIKENIRENLSLDLLSDKACLSKSHFSRCFKNELGLSQSDFILKERLKLAKQYLTQTSYQIKEVCFMAGFNNINYFIRAFKQEYKKTPNAFRTEKKG
jgi:AraC family transcriptional regulator